MSYGSLPGLCCCSLSLVYRPEATILELREEKLVPLPNTHRDGHAHTLSQSLEKGVESQRVIL